GVVAFFPGRAPPGRVVGGGRSEPFAAPVILYRRQSGPPSPPAGVSRRHQAYGRKQLDAA
ncbi:MAG: hypothetical protein ACRDYY_12895, partial [Acidimicrobiales bacterium]